jgi:UDP-glucose 4-epimerase
MKWLITGGGGYIGSHVVLELIKKGIEPIVIDSKPKKDALLQSVHYQYYQSDIRDIGKLKLIFSENKIEGVMNFAALKSADESTEKPELYQEVNLEAVKNLLDCAIKVGTRFFIQSSTAAVYGNSQDRFVDESSSTNPISPYGSTKLEAESLVTAAVDSGEFYGTSLRYFNAAGAAVPELIERSTANLIPKVIYQYKNGITPVIYGDDYPTDDGTCVRDYVHVADLATAHVLVASKLHDRSFPTILNLGTGDGHTVKEVMKIIKAEMKSDLDPEVVGRRPGDPDFLVAKVGLAEKVLGYKAKLTIKEMVKSSIHV